MDPVLLWDGVKGADKYRVYRKEAGGSWVVVADNITNLGLRDFGLKAGTKYYYCLKAYNDGGWSGSGKAVSVTLAPAAPIITRVVSSDGGKATIKWDASDGATKYRLYRKVAGGSWETVSASITKTSYVDTGLEAGKRYSYCVKAYNAGGWSANSAAKAVTAK